MLELSTSRPRVIGWLRSAAILDGDWGTSIAYVLGIAFALAGYHSGLHLIMMTAFMTLVALNYITICRLYPSGGGVYSSVSHRSRNLAVVAALLLMADFVVTVALSIFEAAHYFHFDYPEFFAIGFIIILGIINWFGPRHAGSLAIAISAATILALIILIIKVFPSAIESVRIEPVPGGFFKNWEIFVGIILAISGIESISNMTGVMKDPMRSSRKAILVVLTKIVIAMLVLGFAMLGLPNLSQEHHTEAMIRHLATVHLGEWFGSIIGLTLGFLLISAGNTAINALISIQFLMAVDGELPKGLRRLNKHGVPVIPLTISTLLPIIVLLLVNDVLTLAELYAIGVVGAVLINIGSTSTDREISLKTWIRIFMLISTAILAFVELTIIIQKWKALIFVSIILASGLSARYLARRHKASSIQTTIQTSVATVNTVTAKQAPGTFSSRIMVAVRGAGDKLLRKACEEAKLRKAYLFILHIKQIAVVGTLPETIPATSYGGLEWIDKICNEYEIPYRVITIISNEVSYTIAEQAATLGVDRLILGASQRTLVERALRGDVLRTVSLLLPEEIELVIYRA